MKNKLWLVLIAVLVGFPVSSFALSNTTKFDITATVPAATGINIVATQVNSADNKFGAQVSKLDFNPLTFNSENSVWLPDHYFAIDVGTVNGSGTPAVSVSYGSEAVPTGQAKGLGSKSTATFVKITGATGSQTETALASHGPKKLLKALTTAENITSAEIAGGFLRVYVGIYPGGDSGINAAGGEPFINSDKPGNYTGVLTLTATIP